MDKEFQYYAEKMKYAIECATTDGKTNAGDALYFFGFQLGEQGRKKFAEWISHPDRRGN